MMAFQQPVSSSYRNDALPLLGGPPPRLTTSAPDRDVSTPPPHTPSSDYPRYQPPSRGSSVNPSPSDPNPSSTFPPGSSLSSLPPHLSPAAPNTPAPSETRVTRSPGSNNNQPSNASPNSPSRHGSIGGIVDVDTVLKAAGGDLRLALDMLVTERNSFHSQNTQLWKVIEKQRKQAARLVNDNDRLRGERDKATTLSPSSTSQGVGLGIASPEQEKRTEPPHLRRRESDQTTSPIAEESEEDCVRRRPTKPSLRALTTGEDTMPPASPMKSTPSSFTSAKTPTAGQTQLLPSPPLDPPSASQQSSRRKQAESKLSFPPEVQKYMALAESANRDSVDSYTPPNTSVPRPQDSISSSTSRVDHTSASLETSHQDDIQRPRIPAINALTATPPQQQASGLPPLVPLSPFFTDSPGSSSSAQRAGPSSGQSNSTGTSAAESESPQHESLRSHHTTDSGYSGQRTAPHTECKATGEVPPPYGVSLTSPHQPRLVPALLPYARVTIPNSSIYPNALGKDVLCFLVSITVRPPSQTPPVTWTVGKLFSAFIELDGDIKSRVGGGRREMRNLGVQPLPEGRAWKDFAPSKIDQRKATLESYLQSLLKAPLADKGDLCEFLSTDHVSGGVSSIGPMSGRKEGYLTKKGKNFGGWKTRYFVLQGPHMQYYESRGGTHLGTIPIVNAQIGRQHKDKPIELADDNSYRHAFLIIEARRSGSTSSTRHVLCADSDAERDSWVEMLVRYVTGEYNPPSLSEDEYAVDKSPPVPPALPRSSTSSSVTTDTNRRAPAMRKHSSEIVITRGTAQPLSTLSADSSNAKLFQPMPSPSIINAMEASGHRRGVSTASSILPIDQRGDSPHPSVTSVMSAESPLSSSLPVNLSSTLPQPVDAYERPASALGAAPIDQTGRKLKRQSVMPPPKTERMADRAARQSFAPSYLSRMTSGAAGQDQQDASRLLTQKISAPSGGQPIPTGYKFGAKDVAETPDRDRKAKSGRFWGFGKNDRHAGGPSIPSRPVFGTPLADSVSVAMVADLPAIVFRCIQYLEAKRAEEEEGIYRLSGSSAVIKGLRDRFNMEGDVDLLANDEFWDPHAIAGLLKSYLRELPTSLLTRELHLHFIATMDLIDPRERVSELSRLVSELPSPNYTLLRALTSHLILVVKNCAINKMTLRNIGIVFSPTLGIPAGIFSELVSHFTAVFDDEPEDLTAGAVETQVATPRAPDGAEYSTRRNRNSILYQAAGAEAMLGLGGRELDDQADDSESDLEQPVDSDLESSYDPDATVQQVDVGDVEGNEVQSASSLRKGPAVAEEKSLKVDSTRRTSESAPSTARASPRSNLPSSPHPQ